MSSMSCKTRLQFAQFTQSKQFYFTNIFSKLVKSKIKTKLGKLDKLLKLLKFFKIRNPHAGMLEQKKSAGVSYTPIAENAVNLNNLYKLFKFKQPTPVFKQPTRVFLYLGN